MITKAQFNDCGADGKPITSHVFYAQFNPNEISISEAVSTYTDTGAVKDLQKDKQVSVSMTLFYNTYYSLSQKEFDDVRKSIRAFYPYTNKDTKKSDDIKKIAFTWGSICVCGVLTKFDVKYTMFAPTGIPVRGEATITIEGNYYGDSKDEASFKKEEETKEHNTFESLVKSYKEPQLWKEEARSSGVKKART